MTAGTSSPDGRRVLVAVVTGVVGEAIQAWREEHDPRQARRLPPHATLCYWVPDVPAEALEAQVRHAFARLVTVQLGRVRQFDNHDRTFYVEVGETGELDAARNRLYDGTHLALPGDPDFTWHVTCVRRSRGRDIDSLRAAADELAAEIGREPRWTIDTVAWLELRDGVYQPLATWQV
ncbi:MAG: 2'-5' RNA ligase family protein [Thermomicrobiales bacterium]